MTVADERARNFGGDVARYGSNLGHVATVPAEDLTPGGKLHPAARAGTKRFLPRRQQKNRTICSRPGLHDQFRRIRVSLLMIAELVLVQHLD